MHAAGIPPVRRDFEDILPGQGHFFRAYCDKIIYKAYGGCGYSTKEIALRPGGHCIAISRAVKRAGYPDDGE